MRPVEEVEIQPIHDFVMARPWLDNKKNRYLRNISKQLLKPAKSNFKPIFNVMVKSGEVYQLKGDQNPAEHDAWPRCIFNPSDNACGILVYVQQFIFQDLKSIGKNGEIVAEEFIHGMTSESLVDRIKLLLKNQDLKGLRSVSLDGSSFDSNQNRFV